MTDTTGQTCPEQSDSSQTVSPNDRFFLNKSANSAFDNVDSNDSHIVTLKTFTNRQPAAIKVAFKAKQSESNLCDARTPSNDSTYMFVSSKSQVASPDGWMRLVSAAEKSSCSSNYLSGDREWKFNSICRQSKDEVADEWDSVLQGISRMESSLPCSQGRAEEEASPLRIAHDDVMMGNNAETYDVHEETTTADNFMSGWFCARAKCFVGMSLSCCSLQATSSIPGFQMFRVCFSGKR